MQVRSRTLALDHVRGVGASSEVLVAWVLPIAFVVVLATAARFLLLGHQSLWYDEIVSLTLAKQSFTAMLHDISRTESTPPLYYVLLWVWVRAFGTTAEALRSLSAIFGVLTVVVLYLAARLRFTGGAALVAGALAATNPMLIWYSQETRSYALVTFFLALSLYFMLRAPQGGPGALAGWSVAASLALMSHYFAVFLVLPEGVYLAWVYRRRLGLILAALAGPLVIEAALLPLATHQRDSGHSAFIAAIPLQSRVLGTLNRYLLGPYGTSGSHVLELSLLVAVAGAVSIIRWGSPAVKRYSLLLAGMAVVTFVLPLVVVPGSFRDKNLIVVLPPLLLVAGAAFVPRVSRPLGVGLGLAAAVVLLAPTVEAARRLDLQREDWRGMAKLIGPPRPTRAVLTYPQWEYIALTHYQPDLEPVTKGALRIRELVVVGRQQLNTLRLPAGYHRIEDRPLGGLRLVRLRSNTQRTLNVAALHLHPLLRLLHQYHSLAHAPGQDATLLIDRAR